MKSHWRISRMLYTCVNGNIQYVTNESSTAKRKFLWNLYFRYGPWCYFVNIADHLFMSIENSRYRQYEVILKKKYRTYKNVYFNEQETSKSWMPIQNILWSNYYWKDITVTIKDESKCNCSEVLKQKKIIKANL